MFFTIWKIIKKFNKFGCRPLTFFLWISERLFLLPLLYLDNWIFSVSFTSLLLSDEIRRATWRENRQKIKNISLYYFRFRHCRATEMKAMTGRSNHGTSVQLCDWAARWEPRGGEIPMRSKAWPEETFPQALEALSQGISRINTDN